MGGRAAVWLVLLVEDCCYEYSLQVAVLLPSLPLQPWRDGGGKIFVIKKN